LNNLFFNPRHYNLGRVGRYKLDKRLGREISETRHDNLALTQEDLIEIVRHIVMVNNGMEKPDDIDHLSNRRLRTVGELIQNQCHVALFNLERMIKERMSIVDPETVTPNALLNYVSSWTKPILWRS
jgi:DNA-directed RNA polymerase subunit beta